MATAASTATAVSVSSDATSRRKRPTRATHASLLCRRTGAGGAAGGGTSRCSRAPVVATNHHLLVGGRPLGAGEGVLDHRRLVLQRVAGAAGQRQRDPHMVGGAGRQRAQVRERKVGTDHRRRG